MKIKHLFVSVLFAAGLQFVTAQTALQQQFTKTPVQEARPWTFWYWMFGAVTPEGITADLEAMHRVGLGGAYLMPIKGVE
ncbi:glycosyl hydrolase, partial [Phocaeicola sartorii]